ncbi:MAG TPA: iron-sulfur cluster co-chaperone HscB C-terminal domain-containing protein [Planctomycetota bacterium]|nr:iron-sulfur cluster co-chaperone HscB C-terminal domain-containing protein [Planctomycetota bacterium]
MLSNAMDAKPALPACPHCQKPLFTRLACSACGALFLADGCDAFDQLGIPAQFAVDPLQVETNYLAVSRLAHPDRHVAGSEEAQDRAEGVMALANRARAALLDDCARAELLQARLQNASGAKPPPAKVQPPPDFLMEVMELTEQLAAANDSEKAAMADNIRSRLAEYKRELALLFAAAGDEAKRAAQVRSTLDRMAYWHRLLENATGTGEHKLVS